MRASAGNKKRGTGYCDQHAGVGMELWFSHFSSIRSLEDRNERNLSKDFKAPKSLGVASILSSLLLGVRKSTSERDACGRPQQHELCIPVAGKNANSLTEGAHAVYPAFVS